MAEMVVVDRDIEAAQKAGTLPVFVAQMERNSRARTEALFIEQNALIKRQVEAAEVGASNWPSNNQQLFADVFATCLEARKTQLTTATTDKTLRDVARDAAVMAEEAWLHLKPLMEAEA